MIFQNVPNTTRRFAARGISDNFEILLAVLLPNTTASHAITYTNRIAQYYVRLLLPYQLIFIN